MLCCTFIPANTGPEGSFTKAIRGLKSLSVEMASHSGVSDEAEGWFGRIFGRWKGMITAVFVPMLTVVVLLSFFVVVVSQ